MGPELKTAGPRLHPNLTIEFLTSPQTVSVNRCEADLLLSFFRPPGRGAGVQAVLTTAMLFLRAPRPTFGQPRPDAGLSRRRHLKLRRLDLRHSNVQAPDDIGQAPTGLGRCPDRLKPGKVRGTRETTFALEIPYLSLNLSMYLDYLTSLRAHDGHRRCSHHTRSRQDA